MKPVTKIIFTDDNGIKFFGEGPFRLLCCVEKTGSLRAAAMEMEMAYSKASKLLKQAETNLGFSLTTRSAGGKDGGGSVLTHEGKRWLRQYEAYRDACVKSNQALYRRFFPQIGCVIMASGLSKRFDSNKLMADFHGAPLITAVITCIILALLVVYTFTGKEKLRNTIKVITLIGTIISLGPLMFGINFFSIVGALISVSLLSETILLFYTAKGPQAKTPE